jgi:NitT/TauT family transport system permease protein
VLVLGTWEALVRWLQVPAFILPPPSAIAGQLLTMGGSALFWTDLAITLHEVLAGYVLAIVLAVVLGVAIAQLPILELSLMPYIVAFQTIPSVALAPLFLQWFGYGSASKVVMAALIAFFPILVNVIAGLQASSRDEVQMLRAFGATRTQTLLKLRVPNALPYVFAAWSWAWCLRWWVPSSRNSSAPRPGWATASCNTTSSSTLPACSAC